MAREHEMADVFVELADTLVDDFDVVEYLDALTRRCVELFDVDVASLLLADQRGEVGTLASSAEESVLTDVLEMQSREGPSVECFRTAEVVSHPDLTAADGRWPAFAPAAVRAGLRSVTALPMRLRNDVIGALNLFRAGTGELAYDDLRVAQAMANHRTAPGAGHLPPAGAGRTVADGTEQPGHDRAGQGRAVGAAEAGHERVVHHPADLRAQPQPAAVRGGPQRRGGRADPAAVRREEEAALITHRPHRQPAASASTSSGG
jgi:hypothetical protein